ncbi:hypothetical protein JL107_14690 [Nakamurella flavida]|uniref:Lycopene cyclase family protein n=1 Tax=Nakamurella flavida TaxID=363630 RepID=A0A938YHC5_9ACTN|nr:lycopene cyclase family protein [Nakamurella flavida]MBM9477696.1 hypothetical protein [Nakamurella flavida]MDP9779248.1 lycopene beta-cyclase [Nakamurella flavida]
MQARRRVVVMGAGPAGLATALACATRGLAVEIIAPHFRPWTPTYGMWADQLPALDAVVGGTECRTPDLGTQVYPETVVRTSTGGTVELGRGYSRLDNAALHATLLQRLTDAGATTRCGRVAGVVPGPPAVLTLEGGATVHADVVVDARGAGRGTAQQRAWGERVTGPVQELVPDGTALLMDWVALRDRDTPQPPAFLYGFPLADGTTLLEATSLAGRPPVPLTHLRDRLHALLRHRGLTVAGEPERVTIPLDAPSRRGSGIGVGAAAGMIHPATGYSLAPVLRLAPRIADAVAAETDPRRLAAAIEDLRPTGTGALLALGREVLLRFDEQRTDEFFGGFFTLPAATWSAYLDPTSPAVQVATAMVRLGPALPTPARRALARAVVGTGAAGVRSTVRRGLSRS